MCNPLSTTSKGQTRSCPYSFSLNRKRPRSAEEPAVLSSANQTCRNICYAQFTVSGALSLAPENGMRGRTL